MIEAIDVHKSFDAGEETVEALRGVTFRLPRESCTFIVGPSGSGKSTLLYLIGALDRPTSGTIRVDGRDITAMTEAEQDAYRRDRVGFVYQSFNLIGNLSAVGNVLMPYIPLGVTPDLRAKAEELLRQVGMGDRLNHRPAPALGRTAAARGGGPGADQGPGAHPRRRADRQPRPGRRRRDHPAPARAGGRPW